MDNHVFINYGKDGLGYPEKTQLLISGTIKSIFPLTLIGDRKSKKGVFDTSGFIRLKDYRNLKLTELLKIIELITSAFDEISRYPIFIEDMVITPDTIFVNKTLTQIRILYIPSYRHSSIQDTFSYLVYSLNRNTDDVNSNIVKTIIKYVKENDFDTRKIRELLSDIKVECN